MLRPAFRSRTEALGFCIFVLLILAAPLISSWLFPPGSSTSSSSESIRWERYPWVQRLIYEESGDIDIAFVGSSHLLYGIDTPAVQRELDARLGRPSTVRSICWKGAGFDALFFNARDLLAKRKVRLLVIYDETAGDARNSYNEVQLYAPSWFRYASYRGDIQRLPTETRLSYYFASVVGMPRNLIEPFTPNLARNPAANPENFVHWEPSRPEGLGSVSRDLAYDLKKGPRAGRFVDYSPARSPVAPDMIICRPETHSKFQFLNQPLPEFQADFARRFASLAKDHGCKIVVLNVPMFPDRSSTRMVESRNWPDFLNTDVTLIGIPPVAVFSGMNDAEISQLYFDPAHLNTNGQRHFTALAIPGILDQYETIGSR
jgi:hypothetical protein